MANLTVQSESVKPLQAPEDAPKRTKAAHRPRFLLMYHRDRWHVMHGHLAPQLYPWSIRPGQSGVDLKGRFRKALAVQRGRGFVEIPEDVDAAQGHASYLKRTLNHKNHEVYHTRWEKLYIGSDTVTSDEKAFAAWSASLVGRVDGVDPCPQWRIAQMLEKLRTNLADMHARQQRFPGLYAAAIAKAEVDIAVLEKHLKPEEAPAEDVAALQLKDEPVATCSEPGCTNKPRTGGRCGKHHTAWKAAQGGDDG